ncbi:hypothetical protein [Salinibacterium sp. ZJ77]|uniref:hypothetical protein n=1 Tax=Salinibacterium sp. ZJ77 TaxID=2708337 RepID=UPI00141E7A35|nr:hypothetical protein [Salinibacterium sp. ZJ77]
MIPTPHAITTLRDRHSASRGTRATHGILVGVALGTAIAVAATLASAPEELAVVTAKIEAYAQSNAQAVEVSHPEVRADLSTQFESIRGEYEATSGLETLKAGGTNVDWAKMVLLFAGYPITDDSVTVIGRWMRQENYPETWWNRNNPLNNGWGASYGPGGTGSNTNLVDAARNAADALNSIGKYSEIREAFLAGADAATIENAIWYSGWASGMYNNGKHWHYHDIKVVKAPASAWG